MLPKIDLPVYAITLPLLKQEVTFRPFLVKEQKILLIGMESDDRKFVYNNVRQIIKNCCLSEINVDELSALDIEYFFLNLRARSIGEIVETKFRCQNNISDEEGDEEICKNLMPVNIDLLKIDPNLSNYTDNIKITEDIGIKLRYPNFKTFEKMDNNKSIIEKTFDVIIDCIDYIYDNDNFYYSKELSKQELTDFIESLSIEKFKEIEKFFNSLPTIRYEVDVKCSKCGFQHKILLEGIESFLD